MSEKISGSLPFISVIIPVKPGGEVKALPAIMDLEYPAERIEIIIAEGRHPAIQRNEAARRAEGEILYFLDDDSFPPPENLKLVSEHFKTPEVVVVGGPSIAREADTFIQRCFSYLFSSFMGGAGIRNRYRRVGGARESSEKELILCNLAFRADIYLDLGGLDERLYPNEENELMFRIKKKGYKLIHNPEIYVKRSQRDNLRSFVRQIINYGRGRMEQTLISPSSFESFHFIPLIFLLYCISLFFIREDLYFIPLYLYAALVFFSSFISVPSVERISGGLVLLFLLPLMHISYGLGIIWGLIKYIFMKTDKQVSVTIRYVYLNEADEA